MSKKIIFNSETGELERYATRKQRTQKKKNTHGIGFFRALFILLCPPIAVLDKGFWSILLVLVLTFIYWIPGIIAAIIICSRK